MGQAGVRYLGCAAQGTGMDRKGAGTVMTKKNVVIGAILLNIGMICDLCRLCDDEELAGELSRVFFDERKTLSEITDALIALDKEENPS